MEKEEHARMLHRVDTERAREGEPKGDNGQEGHREKTEGQWGRGESCGSEGGNGLLYQTPAETSRVK